MTKGQMESAAASAISVNLAPSSGGIVKKPCQACISGNTPNATKGAVAKSSPLVPARTDGGGGDDDDDDDDDEEEEDDIEAWAGRVCIACWVSKPIRPAQPIVDLQ